MPQHAAAILTYIREHIHHPLKMKELARALEVPIDEYRHFRAEVKRLLDSGELVMLKRSRLGLPGPMNLITGQFQMTKSGNGFVSKTGTPIASANPDDILIPPHATLTALDGDIVLVRIGPIRGDRVSGEVIKVVSRSGKRIVGTFRAQRHFLFVTPDNPRLHRDFYVTEETASGAEEGEKVVAELVAWDNPHLNPEGRVLERLGRPGDPGVDMLTVLRAYDLPTSFPPQVLSEAEESAARFGSELPDTITGRVDLTHECIFTIDPVDAKDHDDAISVTKETDGYRLGVHIADVSYFVPENSALDTEALRRGNSVYLPGMVVPMLPEILSNDVCSLRPNRRRLAHSVYMKVSATGDIKSWEFADTIIESKAKLSYEDVHHFFSDDAQTEIPKEIAETLQLARELANVMSKRRFAEGSLDFDLPESRIVLGPKGEVLELGTKVRLESHRLIEEFMLAANKAVALEAFRRAVPFLYRVHDKPSLEQMEAFSSLVERLGLKFPVSPNIGPKPFSEFLRQVADLPEAEFVNELMLRSMKKAVYQRENIGHFGLAFKHYTHFTSPIRRYPDLVVHRLLRRLRDGSFVPPFTTKVNSIIDQVSQHCSTTERTAEAAERLAVRIKQVAFMATQVGTEFDGVISGVMPFGFFVRLKILGAEGLVRLSTLDDDYYRHDETNHRIIGTSTRKIFRLGDAVRVGILRVDTERREVDLYLVGAVASGEKRDKGAFVKKRPLPHERNRGGASSRSARKSGGRPSTANHPAKQRSKNRPGSKAKRGGR